MNEIQIGGVTEHFNLPWNLAVEQGAFTHGGVPVNWKFFPGGTGVMTEALHTGVLDMAILLTEGYVAAACKGLKAKVVKEYIASPLGWGIFTGGGSGINSIYNRTAKKYAISRKGSGSHLMALIHAEQRGEAINEQNFIEVKSLEGAIESLVKHESNIFYWEKYTTKPFVTSGQVRMIGEFSAPWSGFLIVATEQALNTKRDAIKRVLDVINRESLHFTQRPDAVSLLTERFAMSPEDALIWLRATVWNCDFSLRKSSLENAAAELQKAGILSSRPSVEKFCDAMVELV